MNKSRQILNAFCIVGSLALSLPVRASEAASTRVPSAALWRDRGNIESLNLVYGPGGK
jgi:hypothetical protein